MAYRIAGRLVTERVEPGALRGLPRLGYIRKRLLDAIDKCRPDLVVFEDYVMGFRKGTGRLAHLGEVGGALKLAVWSMGLDVMIVPSATLKSVVAGSGKADKAAVQKALRVKYGYHVPQEDEADATALLLIGEAHCGSGELNLDKKRREAISRCDVQLGQVKLAAPSR